LPRGESPASMRVAFVRHCGREFAPKGRATRMGRWESQRSFPCYHLHRHFPPCRRFSRRWHSLTGPCDPTRSELCLLLGESQRDRLPRSSTYPTASGGQVLDPAWGHSDISN
jgi:hypothetical protein